LLALGQVHFIVASFYHFVGELQNVLLKFMYFILILMLCFVWIEFIEGIHVLLKPMAKLRQKPYLLTLFFITNQLSSKCSFYAHVFTQVFAYLFGLAKCQIDFAHKFVFFDRHESLAAELVLCEFEDVDLRIL